jgi:hypothetical protein
VPDSAQKKYFSNDEFEEAVNSTENHYSRNPSQTLQKRPPFTFQSGAIYDGEWLANMRQGYGL